MSGAARDLFAQYTRMAHHYPRDDVIDAAANVLLQALVQQHGTREAAEEHLDHLSANIKRRFGEQHYGEDGKRGKQRIVIPSIEQLMAYN